MYDSIIYYLYQIFIKTILSFCILEIIELIGGVDFVIKALVALLALDFILGLIQAYRQGKFSYSRLNEGLIKFILYGIALIVGNQTDIICFHTTVEFGWKNFIVVYLGITESLSLVKHLAHFGMKFPPQLIVALENFRDKEIIIGKNNTTGPV